MLLNSRRLLINRQEMVWIDAKGQRVGHLSRGRVVDKYPPRQLKAHKSAVDSESPKSQPADLRLCLCCLWTSARNTAGYLALLPLEKFTAPSPILLMTSLGLSLDCLNRRTTPAFRCHGLQLVSVAVSCGLIDAAIASEIGMSSPAFLVLYHSESTNEEYLCFSTSHRFASLCIRTSLPLKLNAPSQHPQRQLLAARHWLVPK